MNTSTVLRIEPSVVGDADPAYCHLVRGSVTWTIGFDLTRTRPTIVG